ncbi:MAG: hypothetical protein HKN96_04960 [Flavobacteriaceae bacterium]|nr:hypothetical protein [Bacteroidia bacterium]NND10537.1 hypothetical protein [Flavobacteriaceae bacterium]NNL59700.1 hypothetical protein [Flavobacteriaceae bacterium]
MVLGSLVATLIAITPFIFYSYESVPSTPTWDTFLFTFESKFYQDANAAAWVLMMKFVPLLLLFVWFFTCRHWWYHAILVPIAMFSFQLVSAYAHETDPMDEFHTIYLLPMMAIIIPSIYLIRAKMFNKMNANKSLQELEDEFTMRPKGILGKLKDYF